MNSELHSKAKITTEAKLSPLGFTIDVTDRACEASNQIKEPIKNRNLRKLVKANK